MMAKWNKQLKRDLMPKAMVASTSSVKRTSFLGWILAIIVGLVLFSSFSTLALTQAAVDSISRQLPFSARLATTDNIVAPNGEYGLTFRLYTVASGGTAVWEEKQTVTVNDGAVFARLGSVTALPTSLNFNGSDYYLGVTIDGEPAELSPRRHIGAVPTAINADTVDGAHAGTTANTVLKLNGSGNIDIAGGATLGGALAVSGASTLSGSLAVTGTTTLSSSLAVTGNATFDINTLYVDATNNRVGIGNVAPATLLHVTGVTEQLRLGYDATNYASFTTDSAGRLIISPTGGQTTITGTLVASSSSSLSGQTTITSTSTPQLTIRYDASNYFGQSVSSTGAVTLDATGTGAGFTVADATSLSSTLGVTGATTLGSTLGVTGATTLSSTLGVSGTTTLTGLLTANGGITADGGAFTVADTSGNVATSGTLSVTGATTLSSTLGVTGATTLSSTLGVTGATTLSSTLAVTGNATFDTNTLFVDATNNRVGIGNVAPATLLHVTGVTEQLRLGYDATNYSSFTTNSAGQLTIAPTGGQTTITGTLISSSSSTLNGQTTITSTSTPQLTIRYDASNYLGQSVSSTGAVTFDATGTGAGFTIADATSLSSTLGVTGATTLGSTLGVTGVTTLSSTLGVSGATTLSSTLGVTGGTTLTGLLTANGGITADGGVFTVADTSGNVATSGTLTVTGATSLSSTLGVTGATTLSSTLAVTGNATFDTNTLFVDATNNRVGIGTTGPTYVLDVQSTNPGTALFRANRTGTSRGLAVDSDGLLQSHIDATSTTGVGFTSTLVRESSGAGTEATGVNVIANVTATAGTDTNQAMLISGTINQSGTATGLIKGLAINPTLTSLTGTYRSIDIITNSASAYGIYQSGGSTRNYFAGNVGIGLTAPASLLNISGSKSAAAWTTTGLQLAVDAATLTDTTTAAAGTVATRAANSFGTPTLASTNAITVTNAATLYVANAPAAGTNTTITNPYALYVAAGANYFGGAVTFASTVSTGAATLSSLAVTNNATVGGTLGVTGATSLSSTLAVTGLLTANGGITADAGVFTVADTSGNVATSGTLSVTGATTLSSTLGVTGATTLSSTLAVSGATTLSSTLSVSVGSVSAPGIYLGSDSNSGFYSVADGTLSYSSNGVSKWLASANTGLTPATQAIRLDDSMGLSWSTDPDSQPDEFLLYRESASNLRLTNGAATSNSPNFRVDGKIGIGVAPAAQLNIAGNQSSAAWTTTGLQLAVNAATLTDTTTAASGVVATRAANSLGTPTLASTNAITVTNASTLYIAGAPAAGTNTTITNPYALYVAGGATNLSGATTIGSTLGVTGATTLSSTLALTGAATLSSTLAVSGNATFDTDTMFVDAANNRVGIGTTGPGAKLHIVAGTGASATDYALHVTRTLTADTTTYGALFDFTGNATAANRTQFGLVSTLNAGYASNENSAGGIFNNYSTGGASQGIAFYGGRVALGARGYALGAAPVNTGLFGIADNGTLYNYGVWGMAKTANTGSNIGVVGQAEASTGGSNIGGLFVLGLASTDPTLVSAALLVDNATTAAPILIARDNGTAVFTIADGGAITATGAQTIGGAVDINSTLQLNATGTATTNGLCHSGVNSDTTFTDREVVACSGAPADLAEWYPAQAGVEAGDIVAASDQTMAYQAEGADVESGLIRSLGTQNITIMKKATAGDRLYGVISTAPFQTFGRDVRKATNSAKPVALIGRVPVKVAGDSAAISRGDLITVGSESGKAAKLTGAGWVIGRALEDWATGQDKLLLYVNTPWYYAAGLQEATGTYELINSPAGKNLTIATPKLVVSGRLEIEQATVLASILVTKPTVVQTIVANGQIAPNATKIKVVGEGGAVEMTGQPQIPDGEDGQLLIIQGGDETARLTIKDQSVSAGSNLELGASTRSLGKGDILTLTYDANDGVWYEVSYTDN